MSLMIFRHAMLRHYAYAIDADAFVATLIRCFRYFRQAPLFRFLFAFRRRLLPPAMATLFAYAAYCHAITDY